MMDRVVQISRGDCGRYLVSVNPPSPDYEPQLCETHRMARGSAGGIRLTQRWPIVDLTDNT